MIVRLLQFLFFVLIFRLLWRLAAAALGAGRNFHPGPGVAPSAPIPQGEMVRDPLCGVYVLKQRAIEEKRGDKVLHFCSEQCRAAFELRQARAS